MSLTWWNKSERGEFALAYLQRQKELVSSGETPDNPAMSREMIRWTNSWSKDHGLTEIITSRPKTDREFQKSGA
jgi:hypothetical protein